MQPGTGLELSEKSSVGEIRMKENDKAIVLALELTDAQKDEVRKRTGIDLSVISSLKLTATELRDLIAAHDPDKHDQTVGASV